MATRQPSLKWSTLNWSGIFLVDLREASCVYCVKWRKHFTTWIQGLCSALKIFCFTIISLPRGLWENTFAIALPRNPTRLLLISWFVRVCLRSAITEVFFLFLLIFYAKLRYDCLCFQMRKSFKFSAILWILCEFYVRDYKVFSVDWFLARNLKNEQVYLHTNQRFRTWTELNLEHPWCSDRNGMYGSIY